MFYILGTVIIAVIEFLMIYKARAMYSRWPFLYMSIAGVFLVGLGSVPLWDSSRLFNLIVGMMFFINLVFFIIMANYMIRMSLWKDSTIKDVDYIVVLGTKIMSTRIPPNLKSRLDKAIEIYQKFDSRPRILVSGGFSSTNPKSEAEMMRDYLVKNGIKPEVIMTETRSLNTMQNLEYSSIRIRADWQNNYFPQILIITSEYHVPRVNKYANDLHLRPNFVQAKTWKLFKYPAMFREFTAFVWYQRYTLLTTFLMMFVILVSTLVS